MCVWLCADSLAVYDMSVTKTQMRQKASLPFLITLAAAEHWPAGIGSPKYLHTSEVHRQIARKRGKFIFHSNFWNSTYFMLLRISFTEASPISRKLFRWFDAICISDILSTAMRWIGSFSITMLGSLLQRLSSLIHLISILICYTSPTV